MEILIATEHEAQLLKANFRAIAHCLGPTIELKAILPNGEILLSPLGGMKTAAQVASLLEKTNDMLDGYNSLGTL